MITCMIFLQLLNILITSFFSIFFYFLNRALKSEEKILIGHLTVKNPPDLSKSIQYEQY